MLKDLRRNLTITESNTDELNRIVPLGLTPKEAKGWYIHNVLMPWILRGIIAIALSFTVILSTLTPLENYLNSTLAMHMIAEHFVLAAAGSLFAYGIDSLFLVGARLSRSLQEAYALLFKININLNKWGTITFAAAALLAIYWYLPANLDAALISEGFRVEMNFTFIVVGSLVYVGSKQLTKTTKQIAPVIVSKAMGLTGTFLLLTPEYMYRVYPLTEQAEAGVVMLVLMFLMDLTILPVWLYNYFNRTPQSRS